MRKVVIYKKVSYLLDTLPEKEKEMMKDEIERQHPDYFKKKEEKKEVKKYKTSEE